MGKHNLLLIIKIIIIIYVDRVFVTFIDYTTTKTAYYKIQFVLIIRELFSLTAILITIDNNQFNLIIKRYVIDKKYEFYKQNNY